MVAGFSFDYLNQWKSNASKIISRTKHLTVRLNSNTPVQMKTDGAYAAFKLVAGLVVISVSCASHASAQSDPSSDVLKGLKAPVSSERPWQQPDMTEFSKAIKTRAEPEADPQKDYNLAELIDLAERANPETKVAWEQAKQSAAAVGLAQSEYFPVLALNASAEYSREPIPVPESATTAGYLDLKTEQAQPVATLEWVLLDFGRRKSGVLAAKNQLLAANLGFNAQHQQIVFNVQSAFYEYCKARGRIDVAQSALNSALKVQQAVEERNKNGLATA